jgi:sulfatase modifying factor 1
MAASEAAWSEFVNATGYVTVAQRKPDWEELKKQLPPGTPKLDESALVGGAPVFASPKQKFSLQSLAW